MISKLPRVARVRFQLLGGILFCLVLPFALRFGDNVISLTSPNIKSTVIALMVAILLGYFATRRLTNYPGVRAVSYVLVSYTFTFAIVISIFFILRLDYSRYLFVSSYLLCIFWFSVVHFSSRRALKTKLTLIKGGNWEELGKVNLVDWTILESTEQYQKNMGAIVVDLRHEHDKKWEEFIADRVVEGIPVYHSKQIQEMLTGKVSIEHLSENNFGSLLPNVFYVKVKFVIDWLLAIIALPFLLIICAGVAMIMQIVSPGAVFFRQTRLGYRGKPFNVIKFRTMKNNDKSEDEPKADRALAMTKNNDPRITTFGLILRKYRIDELPQIFNILKGEMSWIGPRPEAIALSEWYQEELPYYKYRHILRPGISGWAQVNQGHVATPDLVLEKLHYDFFYIKHFSAWLDLLIVLKTIRTILTGSGSK
ncbi:MAG: sugar transferase [Hyphomicrobiales bacterium]